MCQKYTRVANLKIYEESLFYKDGIQKIFLQGVKPKVVYITGGKAINPLEEST